ncbi:MAG TPA: RodZ domain-containing protein [Rugosibacter sp.]
MRDDLPQPSLTEASAGALVSKNLPGAALRAERESRGLTMDSVARATRFSVHQVEMLEQDAYDSLPGMTTVRGFVRSYTKYLDLDAGPFLAALDSVAPLILPEVRPPRSMGEVRLGARTSRRVVKYLIAAVVAVILALTVYGYMLQQQMQQPALAASTRSAASAAVSPALTSVENAQPKNSGAADTVESVAGANALVENPSSGVVTAVAAPSPSVGLRIVFDGVSWVEIRDATREIILSGEFPAGTTRIVKGKAPFQIWVGKASVVHIFSGERSVDLQPFTRADVARLTVE